MYFTAVLGLSLVLLCFALLSAGCQTRVSEKHYFARTNGKQTNYYRVKITAQSNWFDNVRYVAGDFDEQTVNEYFAGPIATPIEHHDISGNEDESGDTPGEGDTPGGEAESKAVGSTPSDQQDGKNGQDTATKRKKNDGDAAGGTDSGSVPFPSRIGRQGSVFLYIQSARANVIANEIKEIATARDLGNDLAKILNKDVIVARELAADAADDWQTRASSLAGTLEAAQGNTPGDADSVRQLAEQLLQGLDENVAFSDLAGFQAWLTANRYRLMSGDTP